MRLVATLRGWVWSRIFAWASRLTDRSLARVEQLIPPPPRDAFVLAGAVRDQALRRAWELRRAGSTVTVLVWVPEGEGTLAYATSAMHVDVLRWQLRLLTTQIPALALPDFSNYSPDLDQKLAAARRGMKAVVERVVALPAGTQVPPSTVLDVATTFLTLLDELHTLNNARRPADQPSVVTAPVARKRDGTRSLH